GDFHASFRGGEVRRHEQVVVEAVSGRRSGGGQDSRAGLAQTDRDCFTDPLGAAGHEGAATAQLQPLGHPWISRDAILPPERVKLNSRVTGLPGKLPDTLLS